MKALAPIHYRNLVMMLPYESAKAQAANPSGLYKVTGLRPSSRRNHCMLLGCHSASIFLQSLLINIYHLNSTIIRKDVVVSFFYLRNKWLCERVRPSSLFHTNIITPTRLQVNQPHVGRPAAHQWADFPLPSFINSFHC